MDAVPVHLLTREALRVYLSRLNPGGIILTHISNNHLDLTDVVAAVTNAEVTLQITITDVPSEDYAETCLLSDGEEALTAIRNCQRIHAYHNEVGTLINPPGNPNKYATVSKWIWDHGMPVVHVIMVCSNVRQPTASVLSLFECLAENCALRFQQQQCADPHTGLPGPAGVPPLRAAGAHTA